MKLRYIAALILTLACAAPTALTPITPELTATPQSTLSAPSGDKRVHVNTLPTQEVGIVIVDGLTVRQCPVGPDAPAVTDPEKDCSEVYYIERGASVMGDCNYFFAPDIWLNMDGGKTVAVVHDGDRFVEGVCE